MSTVRKNWLLAIASIILVNRLCYTAEFSSSTGAFIDESIAEEIYDCWNTTCSNYSCDCVSLNGFGRYLRHANSTGTQLNRPVEDKLFFSSHSKLPILPSFSGWVATHGQYRFFTVMEQVLSIIGEAKHGLWRIQENGFVREYIIPGKKGLSVDAPNPNDCDNPKLTESDKKIIDDSYAYFIPGAGVKGYVYPDNRIDNNSTLNYIDLSIYHPKFGGKYEDHVPIDLPGWFCTFSQANYPFISDLWKFARDQPLFDVVGPLGKRAGIDVKENWHKVIRIHHILDGQLWANVAEQSNLAGAENELRQTQPNLFGNFTPPTMRMKSVDLSKHPHEIYMTERYFFNEPTIFLLYIIETDDSYIRPDGFYYEELQKRQNYAGRTSPNYFPKIHCKGETDAKYLLGLPTYGAQMPDREKFNLSGGACPQRGGDWGRYPWGNGASGWPNNYQEVVPLCCALAADVKFMGNLWTETWDNSTFGAANAGFGTLDITITFNKNIFGKYDDPYLLRKRESNPYLMELSDKIVYKKNDATFDFPLAFPEKGHHMSFNFVAGLGLNSSCPVVVSKTPPIDNVTLIIVGTVPAGTILIVVIICYLAMKKKNQVNAS